MKKSLFHIVYAVVFALIMGGTVHAQSRSFSTDYIGHNVYWNGTSWVSTGTGYGSVVGPSTGTGDINFYTTGNAASGGLTRTLTQAAAITPAGTVSATAMQAYTGSFGNVNATGTISATNMNVGALNVTNLTVNGGSYSTGGTSATMVTGWPDAIVCNITNPSYGSMIFYAAQLPFSGNNLYWYTAPYGGGTVLQLGFTSSKTFSQYANITTSNCNKSIAQLYTDGQAFNYVGAGGVNGTDGTDNITSGTTKITANSTGYISLTTGGVTTGYFTTTGGLVVPAISTTGTISGTRGYFTQDLGVGRPIESWMLSNTIVTKGQVIADAGVNISGGTGYSWEDGHVSVASNDGTDVEMRTDYVARLKIISNGNVGINTIDPNATLDVYGTVSTTALTVNGVAVTGGGGGSSTPAGAVMYFAMQSCPTGWLVANGSLISRATYADLYTALGTIYSVGDGSTTFGLPDLRGSFIRGWDNGRGYDSGRVFGTSQTDMVGPHTHPFNYALDITTRTLSGGSNKNVDIEGGPNYVTILSNTGIETRPKNVAMQPCIKY